MAFALAERTPVWIVIGTMMMQSSGNGIFNSPNNSSILSVVERSRYGVVSALTQLVRNSANVVSVAVATMIVVTTMATYGVEPKLEAVNPEVATAFVAGLRWAFLALGVAMAAGVAITVYRALTGRRPAVEGGRRGRSRSQRHGRPATTSPTRPGR